jgi:hypothetical protein
MQFTTPPVAVSAAPASSVSEPSTARRKTVASAASVSVSPTPIVHSPPFVGTAAYNGDDTIATQIAAVIVTILFIFIVAAARAMRMKSRG